MTYLASFLAAHQVVSLFLILALGILAGNIKIMGFSLGPSAVIFVAIAFGHYGVSVPDAIRDLGVIFFVYAVGLQAGPRFFRSIRQNGITFLLISIITLFSGAGVVLFLTKLFHLAPGLGVGIFAGALTSTPGLAAALDVAKDPMISIGYGISYPFGIIGVVLFVQAIAKTNRTKNELNQEKQGAAKSKSHVKTHQYVVTNPNCAGKSLVEIDFHSMSKAIVTRIKRGPNINLAYDDFVLHLDDVVMAVGTEPELRKLEHLIGQKTSVDMESTRDIIVREVFISSTKIAGKSLRELEVKELYGVIVTRLWRDDIEFVPTGDTTLELGDLIRVVADKDDVQFFIGIVGQEERRIHETNLLPICIGIVLGVLIGFYPIQFPGGFSFRLGLSGGPLLVALAAGHYGRIGKISLRVPYAARYFSRELGLLLFLASAGTSAGGSFVEVFQKAGLPVLALGALVTTICMVAAYIMAFFFFRLGNLSSIGVVCGAMTSTPALGVVTAQIDSESPTISYASIYAISLVFVTVISQLLALLH
ncbi:MAG: TrkA C-terminal domain-containing protein [Candidatus Omnitrophota bacterium]